PRLLRQEPCQRDLTGRGLLAVCHGLQQIHERLIGLAILRREAWNAGSEVRAVECRGLVDLAGEEAFPKRTERDEADAEFLKRWQDLALRLAIPERVLALHRRHRLDGVRPPDRARGGFGQAEVLHLPLVDQVLDGSGDILDRDIRIDSMLVVQVDRLDLQPRERALNHAPDVFGPAVETTPPRLAFGAWCPAELRVDHDLPS